MVDATLHHFQRADNDERLFAMEPRLRLTRFRIERGTTMDGLSDVVAPRTKGKKYAQQKRKRTERTVIVKRQRFN